MRNYKKRTMGSSEEPSLINNVDELGSVYEGLKALLRLLPGGTEVEHGYVDGTITALPLVQNWTCPT